MQQAEKAVLPAKQFRPVPIRLIDVSLPVLIPGLLHIFVKIEIKFAVNY